MFPHSLQDTYSAMWWWMVQAYWLSYHKLGERDFYKAIREHHSVRAASRLSLELMRMERDLYELNSL